MNWQRKRKELFSNPLEPKRIEKMVKTSLLEADVSENGKVVITKTASTGGYLGKEYLVLDGGGCILIKCYIRLTKLMKILDMVARELRAIHFVVEMSFLIKEQYEIHAVMEVE